MLGNGSTSGLGGQPLPPHSFRVSVAQHLPPRACCRSCRRSRGSWRQAALHTGGRWPGCGSLHPGPCCRHAGGQGWSPAWRICQERGRQQCYIPCIDGTIRATCHSLLGIAPQFRMQMGCGSVDEEAQMQTHSNCKAKGLKTIHTFFYFFLRSFSKFSILNNYFICNWKKMYQTVQWIYCDFTRHYGGCTCYWVVTSALGCGYCCHQLHLTDEHPEAQEDQVTSSKRHTAGKWQGQVCVASQPWISTMVQHGFLLVYLQRVLPLSSSNLWKAARVLTWWPRTCQALCQVPLCQVPLEIRSWLMLTSKPG